MKQFEWTDAAVKQFCRIYTSTKREKDQAAFPIENYRGKRMQGKLEQFKQDWMHQEKVHLQQMAVYQAQLEAEMAEKLDQFASVYGIKNKK